MWLIKGQVRRFWLFWISPSPLLEIFRKSTSLILQKLGWTWRESCWVKKPISNGYVLCFHIYSIPEMTNPGHWEQRGLPGSGLGGTMGGVWPAAQAALVSLAHLEMRLWVTGSTMGPGPGREMTPFIVLLRDKVIWIQMNLKPGKEKLFVGLSG